MALWLTRAGENGEHESKFFGENKIFATWETLDKDLSTLATREDIQNLLAIVYPTASVGKTGHHARQLFAFTKMMQIGDWVIVPNKGKPAVNIAEISGDYVF